MKTLIGAAEPPDKPHHTHTHTSTSTFGNTVVRLLAVVSSGPEPPRRTFPWEGISCCWPPVVTS